MILKKEPEPAGAHPGNKNSKDGNVLPESDPSVRQGTKKIMVSKETILRVIKRVTRL